MTSYAAAPSPVRLWLRIHWRMRVMTEPRQYPRVFGSVRSG